MPERRDVILVPDEYRPNAAAVRAKFDALLRKYDGVPGDAFLEAPIGGRSRVLDRRLAREKKLSRKNRGSADAHRTRRDDQRRTMY
jgi:hypothetical protein